MGELRSTIHNREANEHAGNGELKGGLLRQRALADELSHIAAVRQMQVDQARPQLPSTEQPETVLGSDQKTDSTPSVGAVSVDEPQFAKPEPTPNSVDTHSDNKSSAITSAVGNEAVRLAAEAEDQVADAEGQAEKVLKASELEGNLVECRDGVNKLTQRDKLVVDAIGGAIDKLKRIYARIPDRDYKAQEDVGVLVRALVAAQESIEERSRILQRQTRDRLGEEGMTKRLRTAEEGNGDIPNRQYDEINSLITDFEKAINQAEEDGDNITRFTIRKIRGVTDNLRPSDPLLAIINREVGDLESLLRAVSRGKTKESFEEVKRSARRSKEALNKLRVS